MNNERALIVAFNRCLSIAECIWPEIMDYNIAVRVLNIGADYAGRANQRTNIVYLNPRYAALNLDYMIKEIIPHELAHIVQGIISPYARYAHGKEWKEATRLLGGTPTRLILIPA